MSHSSTPRLVGPGPFALLLILLVGVVLAWPRLFLQGLLPVDGNVLRLFYPNWAYLHAHAPTLTEWPLWNPTRNMGEPFLADPQSLAGYPPAWLLCRLPDYLSFVRVWIAGHTLVAAYFMHAWMLRHTRDPAAATAAAVAIAFNGFFLARGTLLGHFAAAAYLPLVLYMFSSRRPVGLGIALALQWLAGFPPFTAITVIALAGWIVAGVGAASSRKTMARVLVKGGGVALALAAFQIIPFLEMFVHAARPLVLDPRTSVEFSEPIAQLVRMLVVPQWVWWTGALTGDQAVVMFYAGPFVLMAAIWAVIKGTRAERMLGAGVMTCTLLSLGASLPGYTALVPLHFFRFPANWLLLVMVGMVVLAARGISRVPHSGARWLCGALIAADLLLAAQAPRTPWFVPSFLDRPPGLVQSVLAARSGGRLYHSPSAVERLIAQRSNQQDGWLAFHDGLVPSYATAFGVREVSSYQVLKLARAARFQERLAAEGPKSPLARWAGITTVVMPWSAAGLGVATMSIDAPSGPLFFQAEDAAHRVNVTERRPQSIDAIVATDRADVIVFAETAYPGWRAYVDGRRLEPGVFQDTFLTAAVPAGEHRVAFVYAPFTFALGAAISLMAATALGVRLLAHRLHPVGVTS